MPDDGGLGATTACAHRHRPKQVMRTGRPRRVTCWHHWHSLNSLGRRVREAARPVDACERLSALRTLGSGGTRDGEHVAVGRGAAQPVNVGLVNVGLGSRGGRRAATAVRRRCSSATRSRADAECLDDLREAQREDADDCGDAGDITQLPSIGSGRPLTSCIWCVVLRPGNRGARPSISARMQPTDHMSMDAS